MSKGGRSEDCMSDMCSSRSSADPACRCNRLMARFASRSVSCPCGPTIVGIPELIWFCSRVETLGRVVVHPTIDKRQTNRSAAMVFMNDMNSPPSIDRTQPLLSFTAQFYYCTYRATAPSNVWIVIPSVQKWGWLKYQSRVSLRRTYVTFTSILYQGQ